MDLGFVSSVATSQVRSDNSPKFDRCDACYVKSNPSLLGNVLRVHHDIDEPEPLTDFSIYRYTELPENDLKKFMATGMPPKGYVFVGFAEPTHGTSLIHENDLELIDRIFDIGDTVKRHLNDTKSGNIINATTNYTLEPIAFRPVDPVTGDYLSLMFTDKPLSSLDHCSTSETPKVSPCLLYDVPQSVVAREEAFSEGDYIIYHQKLGVVQEVERDAVLLLPNSTVVSPIDPSAIELPVCADPQAAISLPELKHRDLGNGNYLWTTEADFLSPGQSILTGQTNNNRVDRLFGSKGPLLQGHVLATLAEDIHIDWLCPNVFSTGSQESGPNCEVLRASALRGHAVMCDFGKSTSQGSPVARCEASFDIGERVRFRDSIAAVKYPGYQHLPKHETFGHDLNIFRVVSSKTEVVVEWQDGSCTTEAATSMRLSDVGEEELYPGKFVALKDGIKTVDRSATPSRGSVPLRLRGRTKHTLRVPHIGIVQTVDSQERIASVRWYQNPDVELIYGGEALNPHSSLGQLSDAITNVSIYELTTFPALRKFLGDTILIAPASIDQSVMSPPLTNKTTRMASHCHTSLLSTATFSEMSVYLQSMKSAMTTSEWFKNTTTIRVPPLRRRYSVQSDNAIPPVDFFGKIVAMDTSGIITVRLPGPNECRDIQVPFERILMVINLADMLSPMPIPPFDLPGIVSADKYSSRDDPWIPRVGEREDEDFSEDNSFGDDWNTEDESDGSAGSDEFFGAAEGITEVGKKEEGDIVTTSVPEICLDDPQTPCEAKFTAKNAPAPASQASTLPPLFHFPVPASSPPAFAVLEDMPPSDHRFIAGNKSESSLLRTKRIRKEFEILETSLPPDIFVRTWESRIDLLRVMIIGPKGTPYEYAPFVMDIQFTSDFPSQPPSTFFHSWTSGQGAINPNLYEDGKICLSILGTWPTKNPDEAWSPEKSTVLQILVSIIGLVLVKAPFYNEAGYEVLAADGSRSVDSFQYSEKTFLMTRKFILHALNHSVRGLEDVLTWHYLPDSSSTRPQLLRRAIHEALEMIEHHSCSSSGQSDQEPKPSTFLSHLSLGAVVMLKRHVAAFEELESYIIAQQCS
ncbi:hypothetical protein BDW59DRAFT_1214 [Aspergillus cavernicola]|uniref:UBC core domain-containing protein n=1 Tax=Aspergillus cavernicola TaxID=176166 RepID=A0ABR4J5W5_9EURO